ncbi:hypothetical protein ID866_5300 [Astraeus odoratus]|nr:hypothetical protein ID866_5300 [Astraeus odoratus]
MTSFMINEHLDRDPYEEWRQDGQCTFCRIIAKELPSKVVYETEEIVAILDILPLRPGHTLVIPKAHVSHVSELPPDLAAVLGQAVSKVAKALTDAIQNTALNIVCNQEYAQSVPHVHFHVIPAPRLEASGEVSQHNPGGRQKARDMPRTTRELHQLEYEGRNELDEAEGHRLAAKIRAML